MTKRDLPLGFLPGAIAPGSHCMLAYNKPDEAYIQSVARYMTAGIASGQMCVCAVLDPVRRQIKRRMRSLGANPTSGQFLAPDAADIYLPDGKFDVKHTADYYRRIAADAETRWNGLRAFGDISPAIQTRALRIKSLEYEALINSEPKDIIALCGYQTSTLPRGYLLQVKSVHPFIAGNKSIRLNRSFVDTARFLTGLYRFRRVNKEYPADLGQTGRICSDLEEIAIRTMMTMSDIDDMKEAICSVLADVIKALPAESERSHLHIVYAPKPDRFAVSLRYHHASPEEARPRWSLPLAWKMMDTVHIGESGADTIITLSKKY